MARRKLSAQKPRNAPNNRAVRPTSEERSDAPYHRCAPGTAGAACRRDGGTGLRRSRCAHSCARRKLRLRRMLPPVYARRQLRLRSVLDDELARRQLQLRGVRGRRAAVGGRNTASVPLDSARRVRPGAAYGGCTSRRTLHRLRLLAMCVGSSGRALERLRVRAMPRGLT